MSRIRKGEQFAFNIARTHIGEKRPHEWLVDAMLEDLSSDNKQTAERAASLLILANHFPEKAGAIVNSAMMKDISLVAEKGVGTGVPETSDKRVFGFVRLKEQGSASTEMLVTLAGIAARIGTDEGLRAVLSLAHTKEVRGAAISALGHFKQEKALKDLRLFLTDQDEELQFRAAQRLSERKDLEALKVLLTVAHDPKSRWRMYSFNALLKYPEDARIELAIKSGLNDGDSQVRQSAEFALRQLVRKKEPNR